MYFKNMSQTKSGLFILILLIGLVLLGADARRSNAEDFNLVTVPEINEIASIAGETRSPFEYSDIKVVVTTKKYKEKDTREHIRYLIDIMSARFSDTIENEQKLKDILHCLYIRETNYWTNKGFGDNGRAGGPLQFHEPTYVSYRRLMAKDGLVTDVGSRMDLYDATETTAWALVSGRGRAWGPILRKECENY